MKKILIVFNPQKKKVYNITKLLHKKLKSSYRIKIRSSEKFNLKDCVADIILALGGDGTILKVGQAAIKKEIPVIGINLGDLGYLAEFKTKEVFEVIKKYFSGEIIPQRRMILEVKYKNKLIYAINDVVIKPLSSKVCNIELNIGENKITQIIGDGIIVATPTGSTAYSLACGGSIVEPDVEVILITPISPHTLSIRPIIVSKDKEIKLKIPVYKSNKKLLLSIDGQINFELKTLDEIIIKKSLKDLLFVPNPKKDFYKILTQKLSWGKR